MRLLALILFREWRCGINQIIITGIMILLVLSLILVPISCQEKPEPTPTLPPAPALPGPTPTPAPTPTPVIPTPTPASPPPATDEPSLSSVKILPVEVSVGEIQQLEVVAIDEHGNRVSDVDVAWIMIDENAGSITQLGLFTAGEVASIFSDAVEVQVRKGDLVRTVVASITITPGPLEHVIIAPNPAEIGMEMTQQFVAVGADQYGNRISDLVFSWSVQNGSNIIDDTGLFTVGTAAGTYEDTVRAEAMQGGITRYAAADVIVEPDRILFMSDRNEEKPDIYIMDVDGSNVRRLTETSVTEGQFSCSPDGRYILYDSGSGRREIMVMGTDGGGKLCLLKDDVETNHSYPLWSPDSTRLVFSSYNEKEEDSDIYVIDANGANLTQLTDTSELSEDNPSWSPDGTKIVFSSYSEKEEDSDIYVIDADGANLTQLTDTSELSEDDPSWSPDGTKIGYSVEVYSQGSSFYVMNANGSKQRRLIANTRYPEWSPDGTKIVFAPYSIDEEIYVMNVDGSNKRQLTSNKYVIDFEPTWSPDGSKIVFVSGEYTPLALKLFPPGTTIALKSDSEIWVMHADGSHPTCLTDNKDNDMRPQWVPRKSGDQVTEDSVVIPCTS